MKKILFPFFLLSVCWLGAQAFPRFDNDHEIKFNIGLFLVNTSVEGSYEYYLNEDISIGGTLYFDNDAQDFNGDFGIGPNLRAYFGYGPRSGFFAEAFGLYYSGNEDIDTNIAGNRDGDFNSFALGLGLGNKWVTRSQKFILEIHGGFGRNINPEDFQDSFMYRAGLSIGFRF